MAPEVHRKNPRLTKNIFYPAEGVIFWWYNDIVSINSRSCGGLLLCLVRYNTKNKIKIKFLTDISPMKKKTKKN